MKNKNLKKASNSELWRMVAHGIAELAIRNPNSPGSPHVEIRRINDGQPEATISVVLEDARPGGGYGGSDTPPLLCIGNTTLNQKRRHHFETFEVDAKTVARINRAAYRESSSGVVLQ